jgi:hypothetical protein
MFFEKVPPAHESVLSLELYHVQASVGAIARKFFHFASSKRRRKGVQTTLESSLEDAPRKEQGATTSNIARVAHVKEVILRILYSIIRGMPGKFSGQGIPCTYLNYAFTFKTQP